MESCNLPFDSVAALYLLLSISSVTWSKTVLGYSATASTSLVILTISWVASQVIFISSIILLQCPSLHHWIICFGSQLCTLIKTFPSCFQLLPSCLICSTPKTLYNICFMILSLLIFAPPGWTCLKLWTLSAPVPCQTFPVRCSFKYPHLLLAIFPNDSFRFLVLKFVW